MTELATDDPANLGPDDHGHAPLVEATSATLAAAIRDPETMDPCELTPEERSGEIARLAPYRDAIHQANEAWKAKVRERDDTERRLNDEVGAARRALVEAEKAYQPTEIAGRLTQIEALVKAS